MKKLSELNAKELIEKLGQGKEVPGSGSAAAYQAMVSAALVRTVVSITITKSSHSAVHTEFKKIDKTIVERILPRLEELFDLDSDQFHKVVKSRKARNKETQDLKKRSILASIAISELKPAIEYPIEIAGLAEEVAVMAIKVFQEGYKAVRGDSSVALNGALASILGCLSIIDLNLFSFGSDEWTDTKRLQSDQLWTSYESLYKQSVKILGQFRQESKRRGLYHKEINALLATTKGATLNGAEGDNFIEETAAKLHNIIYNYRDVLWEEVSPDPLSILDPVHFFKETLGYQFGVADSLDVEISDGAVYEVAGHIDQKSKFVMVSEKFTPEAQIFTVAHELGHALFHKQDVLHRERLIEGSHVQQSPEEYQANKFAACFLMPRKHVISAFEERFETSKFIVNQDNSYKLINNGLNALKGKCKDTKGLRKLLSTADRFGPRQIVPLTKRFNVSASAMAKRLQELFLVEDFI